MRGCTVFAKISYYARWFDQLGVKRASESPATALITSGRAKSTCGPLGHLRRQTGPALRATDANEELPAWMPVLRSENTIRTC